MPSSGEATGSSWVSPLPAAWAPYTVSSRAHGPSGSSKRCGWSLRCVAGASIVDSEQRPRRQRAAIPVDPLQCAPQYERRQSMTIHQMQIRPDEQEDRLLLRLSTTDAAEFRFWLTRSFVKKLWGMLIKM